MATETESLPAFRNAFLRYAYPALIFAIVVLAYLPAYRGGFLWDDDAHVTANRCIVGPLGFKDIWTSREANYFPLTESNFWLQYRLWGRDSLPYHIITVWLHACSAVLLWRVLRRLKVAGAGLGAALWALHPVQVESVAWICETKNTQSAAFYLLSIWFFLGWLKAAPLSGQRKPVRGYVWSLVFAVSAVLSKSSTVMLPVALGLCWWWLAGRWRWRNLIWLAPFFIISGAAALRTIWDQQVHAGAAGADWSQGWPERLVIAGRVIWFYLGKLVWPHPLVFIYPRWQIDARQWTAWAPVAAAAAVFSVLWWQRSGRLRPAFFAYAYFLALLFPVLGFFNVYFFLFSYVGDHFQYLASMGPLALAGSALATAGSRAQAKNRLAGPMLCVLLPLGLAGLSFRQARIYRNAETLYRTTLEENPDCWMAHVNLGGVLLTTQRYDEAVAHYQAALQLRPNYAQAHYDLGTALAFQDKLSDAVAQFEEALRLKPDYPKAHYNLGSALAQLGNMAGAEAHFTEAIRQNPGFSDAHRGLAFVLIYTGRVREAVPHLEEALRLNPNDTQARDALEKIRRSLGGD